MGKTSKRYTDGYKNTIVELFNRGKTYSELNSEYGLPKTTMKQWVLKDKNKNDDFKNTAQKYYDSQINSEDLNDSQTVNKNRVGAE